MFAFRGTRNYFFTKFTKTQKEGKEKVKVPNVQRFIKVCGGEEIAFSVPSDLLVVKIFVPVCTVIVDPPQPFPLEQGVVLVDVRKIAVQSTDCCLYLFPL